MERCRHITLSPLGFVRMPTDQPRERHKLIPPSAETDSFTGSQGGTNYAAR
jgi:hypothetical protein